MIVAVVLMIRVRVLVRIIVSVRVIGRFVVRVSVNVPSLPPAPHSYVEAFSTVTDLF